MMAYLLYLDTSAQETHVLCLNRDAIVAERRIPESRDHGQYIHGLIEECLHESHLTFNDLDGLVVMNGPGSYTGLRIALSVAKGFCYALNKPLFLLNKLAVSAIASQQFLPDGPRSVIARARADEYFFGRYNPHGEVLEPPRLMLTNELTLVDGPIFTFQTPENCAWNEAKTVTLDSTTLAKRCYDTFLHEKPADLMYAEPFYLKNVYINKINKL